MALSDNLTLEYSLTAPMVHTATWVDVTDKCFGASVTIGPHSGPLGDYSGSQATFRLRNHDAYFNEESGVVSGMRRNDLPVRLTYTHNGTDRILFRGIGNVTVSGDTVDSVATLQCRDLMMLLSFFDYPETERGVELTGTRWDAVMDATGLPAGFRGSTAAGTVLLEAATIGGKTLSVLQECHRAENGFFFFEQHPAEFNFMDRYDYPFTSLNATLDEDAVSHVVPMKLEDYEARLYTAAVASGVTGNLQEYDETPTNHLVRTKSFTGLPTKYDGDAYATARAFWLAKDFTPSGQAAEIIKEVSIKPLSTTTAVKQSLADGELDLLNRISVNGPRLVGTGTDLDEQYRIEGIRHSISEDDWTTRFELSPYRTNRTLQRDDWAIAGTVMNAGNSRFAI